MAQSPSSTSIIPFFSQFLVSQSEGIPLSSAIPMFGTKIQIEFKKSSQKPQTGGKQHLEDKEALNLSPLANQNFLDFFRSPNDRRDNDDFKRSRSGSRGGKRSQERRSPVETENKGNVIYVGNLTRNIEEEDIRKFFDEYGRIENIEIVKDPSTKYSSLAYVYSRECRGFCFVTYSEGAEAEKAKEKSDGQELKGRPMKVQVARRGKGHQKTPGEYLGHSRSRGHRGGRRSPSPYRRRQRRSRSGGRRNSRDRDYRDKRSRSRSGGRGRRGDRDRYRSRSPHDRYHRDRSRSRSPRRR